MNDDDLIENSDVAMFDYHSHSEIGPVKTDIGPKFMAMSTRTTSTPHVRFQKVGFRMDCKHSEHQFWEG